MLFLPIIFSGLVAGTVVATILYIACLTIKKIKELIRERLERRKKQKVAFGNTRKIIGSYAKEIIQNAPEISLDELESVADESPYFVVDFDPETESESDFTLIQTDESEKRLDSLLKENEGIIVFE